MVIVKWQTDHGLFINRYSTNGQDGIYKSAVYHILTANVLIVSGMVWPECILFDPSSYLTELFGTSGDSSQALTNCSDKNYNQLIQP